MALNKYFILCLVLVQPDLKINEVLNIIIIVWVGLPLNGDVWVILVSHLGIRQNSDVSVTSVTLTLPRLYEVG